MPESNRQLKALHQKQKARRRANLRECLTPRRSLDSGSFVFAQDPPLGMTTIANRTLTTLGMTRKKTSGPAEAEPDILHQWSFTELTAP